MFLQNAGHCRRRVAGATPAHAPSAHSSLAHAPSRHAVLLALPLATLLPSGALAGPVALAPEGSLTLALENFPGGIPYYSEPYFVYSSSGGSAPTFNASNDTWNGDGVSGQMLPTSTMTIQGLRYVFQAGTLNGVNNLGISTGDVQTLHSSGVYTNGNYIRAADLNPTIDVADVLVHVRASRIFHGQFTGIMEAGTNTSTGVSYTRASLRWTCPSTSQTSPAARRSATP